ncbi:macrolide export ATP-binding/permease protein MacB [mine drainage metagenome]|uniref:Macrolide export ATP-binding/permease protein MacB n=1 Tax=mine drainage metagenome TaxID=410659 RepID=A0A1J5QL33_9ZZZZ
MSTAEQVPVVDIQDVRKFYGSGDTEVRALDGVSLRVQPGEYVAIMGPSGSGKSTLMNIIGCLDAPTAGSYALDGLPVARLDERQLAIVRNRRIGFVFQSFNLIPRTSAQLNVEMPLAYQGAKKQERREKALLALSAVGLSDRANHQPNELSGGQQQRVAIARALVSRPSLLLADEPTGALDTKSTQEIMGLLERVHSAGRTIIVITHEHEVAQHAKRVITMRDGKIISDEANAA